MDEPGLGNAEHIAHSVDRLVPPSVTKGSPEETFLAAFPTG